MKSYYDDGTCVLYHADVRDVIDLAAGAACVVTSPPYNVGLDYTGYTDRLPWPDYWALAKSAADLMWCELIDGGRLWLNTAVSIPEEPQGPDRPPGKRRWLLAVAWARHLEDAGFNLVDMVSWTSIRAGGTAWGSWQSPAAPNLRGDWEAITLASKGAWERTPPPGQEGWRDGLGAWEGLCTTVWPIGTVSGRIPKGTNTPRRGGAGGHPAPFPVALPIRAIRLSTWPGETILDPFAGTGTTLLAAKLLGRRAVGVEIDEASCQIAAERLSQEVLDG